MTPTDRKVGVFVLNLLVIGLGGFLGATARYGLSSFVRQYATGSFPAATLVVNLSGCLIIGGVMYLVTERQLFTQEIRLFLLVGFLGSFTTLSTVGSETFDFLRMGDYRMAAATAGANMLLCVVAVSIGWVGARAIAT